jgi:hypothetical protein
MHSGHTALNETEIQHFGMDPDSVLAIEDQDYQIYRLICQHYI